MLWFCRSRIISQPQETREKRNQSAEISQFVQPTTVVTSAQEVGEELIGSCVTPTKIKAVQQTLGQERQQDLCVLKLLQFFHLRGTFFELLSEDLINC